MPNRPSRGFTEKSPYKAGFAQGSFGAQIELGYFLGKKHLLSVAGRFGIALTEASDTMVMSVAAMLRYKFFVLGGGRKDIFSLYIGAEAGGGNLWAAWTM